MMANLVPPPSTVARRSDTACPLCHEPIKIGDLITMVMSEGWGHTGCVVARYTASGASGVVKMIEAEAAELRRTWRGHINR
jgi:uncharacterized protein YijF (DUF1287 family)